MIFTFPVACMPVAAATAQAAVNSASAIYAVELVRRAQGQAKEESARLEAGRK